MQRKRGTMLAINGNQPGDQFFVRLQPEFLKSEIENISAPTRREVSDGNLCETSCGKLIAQPEIDRAETTAHVIALRIERIVQVEYEHRAVPPRGCAAGWIDLLERVHRCVHMEDPLFHLRKSRGVIA